MIAEPSAASHELLSFPMKLLPELPVGLRIAVEVPGIHRRIVLDLGPVSGRDASAITFESAEIRALAIGVESERLRPADVKGFCLRKLQDPSFHVTEQLALDGARPSEGRALSLARVLEAIELEFLGFEWPDAASKPSASPPIDVAA
jgi:hypothetical protein